MEAGGAFSAPDALRAQVRALGAAGTPGAVAVFTHAGPSFSLAFGLCGGLFGWSVRDFVASHVVGLEHAPPQVRGPGVGGVNHAPLEGMAPAGFLRAVLDGDTGECVALDRPDNGVWRKLGCGKTRPHRRSYEENPGKYFRPPTAAAAGSLPGGGGGDGSVDRSGD